MPEEIKEESTWLTRLRDEQIENFDRIGKLRKFLGEVDVGDKVSPNMLLLMQRQLVVMEEYDAVLCNRLALADIEEYCRKVSVKKQEQGKVEMV